uniref:Uncharacterized protein n=1 Tax=Anguilla anguilla TaxID=7936 RepID=A0A0E9R8E0_ANGAN
MKPPVKKFWSEFFLDGELVNQNFDNTLQISFS